MCSIFNEKTVEGDDDGPSFATSLPVPNVQEMVMRDPLEIPERYLRNKEDMPKSAHNTSHLSSQIPVIDFSSLTQGNQEELMKLDLACKDWGFFQVINHGVASEVLQGMKDAAVNFFELPLEEKNKISMPPDDIQGYGHAYVVSEEQTLDWQDVLMFIVYPRRYRKHRIWPTKPTEFNEMVEAYSSEVKRVAEELLGSISLAMGMEKRTLQKMHKEMLQALRVNYYPQCPMPDNVLGLSPHSDTSSITILMQDDNVSGLQIRHQREWVLVKPIPNALVVNVGDVIEIWSNGKYRSIEHRAVTNDTYTRLSYASFMAPSDDVEVEPLDHMADSQGSFQMYKKVIYGEYLRESMKRRMEGKAYTEMAKIEG
ncbi:hypothetical protein FNV43_RR09887 [Rhamnella rubrinervis]|uniref:Fe2OG dioxygenase domain-containing protein n=1 Tax=Rhamnella rubrinervis TaxID=2594499 RepID=A0A8K0HC37_9ROSA|nr:hypothetical protein FNV43_RR09887 [Rhamnella rubrinervis]